MKRTTKAVFVLRTLFVLLLCFSFSFFFGCHSSGAFSSGTQPSEQSTPTENDQALNNKRPKQKYSFEEVKEMLGPQPTQFFREYKELGNVVTTEIPLEDEQIEELVNYEPAAEPPFPVVKLRDSGKADSESIVIVFMGDGFTASQQGSWPNPASGTFLYQADSVTTTLLNTHPFSLFASSFTVYAVQVVSQESGITGAPNGSGPTKNTYFGVYFEAASSIRINSTTPALQLAQTVSADRNMVQIIANTNCHGGVAWVSWGTGLAVQLAITATQLSPTNYPYNPPWHGTVIHEFGHAFGRLVDEHDTGAKSELAANSTAATTAATVKWKHWLPANADNIATGIIVNTLPSPHGWSVPAVVSGTPGQSGCIMRASWGARNFCYVCAADLTRRMALVVKETYISKSPSTNDPMPTTTTLTMPSTATRILNYAFNGNTNLQTVTISTNVSTIGDFAFLGSTGLRTITNNRTVPQTINNTTFAGINRSLVTVNIPAGTTAAYQAAGWTGFILKTQTLVATVTGLTAVNRAYDGTTVIALSGGTLSGIESGHDVRLPTTASVATANVGNNKAVTGIALTGADASKYTFTPPSLTVNITQRTINLSALTATSKAYDGTNTATISAVTWANPDSLSTSIFPTISGLNITATFSQSNAGNNLTVSYTVSLTSAWTENFVLGSTRPSVVASITKRAIDFDTITAASKTYDGSTAATITSVTWTNITGLATSILPALNTDFSMTAVFNSANAGSRTVSIGTVTWGTTNCANNFTLGSARPTGTATINKREINIATLSVSSKEFDGTSTASITAVSFTNIDDLPSAAKPTLADLSIAASFTQATVGNGLTVSISSISMAATTAGGNFSIGTARPTTTANITKRTIRLSAITVSDKVYDGTNAATISSVTFTAATLPASFPEASKPTVADLNISATFLQSDAGNNRSVTITSASMGTTALAGNFTLHTELPSATSANITKRTVDLATVTAADKTYDGNNTSSISAITWTSASINGLLTSAIPKLTDLNITAVTFSTLNAGNGLTVSYTASLTSSISGNFTLGASRPTATGNILKRPIELNTITVGDKVYDGFNNAFITAVTFTNISSLSALQQPTIDDVSITAAFGQIDAGDNIRVTITAAGMGPTIRGGNFVLGTVRPSATASIKKRELIVSGFTATGKVYDAVTAVSVATASLSGTSGLAADAIPVFGTDYTLSAAVTNANAGTQTAKVSETTLYPTARMNNFTISFGANLSASVVITPRPIDLSAIIGADKIYDGTTTASFSSVSFANAGSLPVTAIPTVADFKVNATFSQADVGDNLGISYTLSLDATQHAGNFVLGSARPVAAAASIRKRLIELSAITAENKAYDGTDAAKIIGMTFSNTGGVAFNLIPVLGTDFTISGKFSNANVGNRTVSIDAVTWGSTVRANNFTLGSERPPVSAVISQLQLVLGSISAQNKVYDGNNTATITAVTFSNVSALPEAARPGMADIVISATFSRSNAGSSLTVSIANVSMGSSEKAGNFTLGLARPTTLADITPRVIELATISAESKTYDGTTAASISAVAFTNVDILSQSDRPTKNDLNITAAFEKSDIGNNLVISISSVSMGSTSRAGNFTLGTSRPTATANITRREISLESIRAVNKLFDGTNTATLNSVTFSNVADLPPSCVPVLNIDFTVSAVFSQSNVGSGIPVTVVNVNWGSTGRASNYTFILGSNPPKTTANIIMGTATEVTIVGLVAIDRPYDGTRVVNLTGGVLNGVLGGHDVRLPTFATVASADAGNNKQVTVDMTLFGEDTYLYTFVIPVITVNITSRIINLNSIIIANKTFDGTSKATATAVTWADLDIAGIRPTAADLDISAVFAQTSVGSNIVVSIESIKLRAHAGMSNFVLGSALPTATADITPRIINLETITAASKTYDGNNNAVITAVAFTNIDDLPANLRPTFANLTITAVFAQADAGSNLLVSIKEVLLNSTNFTLGNEKPTTVANIARRTIKLEAVFADDKVYDGTNQISVSGVAFSNIEGLAEILVPVLGTDFSITAFINSANVGERVVSVSNVHWLETARANNFTLERGEFPTTTINVLRAVRIDYDAPTVDTVTFNFGLKISDVGLLSPWQWESADTELLPGIYTLQIKLSGGDNYYDVFEDIILKVKHRAPAITVDGTLVTWGNMPNNEGYAIYINGEMVAELGQDITEFDLSTLDIDVDMASATVQVKTLGSDGLSSELSPLPAPTSPYSWTLLIILIAGAVIGVSNIAVLSFAKKKKAYVKGTPKQDNKAKPVAPLRPQTVSPPVSNPPTGPPVIPQRPVIRSSAYNSSVAANPTVAAPRPIPAPAQVSSVPVKPPVAALQPSVSASSHVTSRPPVSTPPPAAPRPTTAPAGVPPVLPRPPIRSSTYVAPTAPPRPPVAPPAR